MTNRITLASTFALPLLVTAAGLVGTASGELTMSGTCAAAWCQNDRDNPTTDAQIREILESQIADLTRGRDCTSTPRLTPTALVANSTHDRAGHRQFDTAVVREVPLDDAFRLAETGSAYVLRWCD